MVLDESLPNSDSEVLIHWKTNMDIAIAYTSIDMTIVQPNSYVYQLHVVTDLTGAGCYY